MAIDLEQLRVFILVAELKSFTKAAEELFISHSTTSRAVSSLEERLGVRLLKRNNHEVSLTTAGRKLLAEGKKLLDGAEELERGMKALTS